MGDRHDNNDYDLAQRVSVLETKDANKETRLKEVETRWETQDSQVLKWLMRALMVLTTGAITGSSDAVKKKVATILSWVGL